MATRLVTWCGFVALLAEGVDRNWSRGTCMDTASASPSSRRAWIEMVYEVVIYTQ